MHLPTKSWRVLWRNSCCWWEWFRADDKRPWECVLPKSFAGRFECVGVYDSLKKKKNLPIPSALVPAYYWFLLLLVLLLLLLHDKRRRKRRRMLIEARVDRDA
jgi:hypothetical protein